MRDKMIILLSLFFLILIVFLARIINKEMGDSLNPYSIMTYIWGPFIVCSSVFAEYVNFYEMKFSGVLFSYAFLLIIGINVLLVLKFFKSGRTERKACFNFNKSILKKTAYIMFSLCIFGNILYWYDVNNVVSIGSIITNPWLLKNYVVNKIIDDNSIKYLGRNLALIGTVLTLLYLDTNKKKHLIMLIIYIFLAFLNIRREPLLIKLIYIFVPVFILYRNKVDIILKRTFPFFIGFCFFFFITLDALTFGEADLTRSLYSYTAGAFNSLQAMIDSGYTEKSDLFLNYTFYWIYAFLKFIFPALGTPNIVLDTIGSNTTNIYTALSAVVIDANGDYFSMAMILMIYGIYVGALIGISSVMITRKVNFFTIIFYSAVISCVVRSYINPTFSFLDIHFALLYGFIMQAIFDYKNKKI